MELRRPPPPYPKPSTIILLGKRVRLKNILGNMILESKDAFITESNEFECKYNNTFKIIRTPDFFDEECQNPDQLIIDLMALSLPGPKLFILAIDSENTQEEKVMAQIKQLQNTFGEKITGNLAVTLPDIESFDSLGHLKEKFSIQMTIANENLASQCKEWCSGRQSFQYDCKGYVEGAVQRRKKALEKTSSNDTPLHQDFSSGADLVSELTSHYACAAESKPDEHRGADSLSMTASKLEPAEEQTHEVYRYCSPKVMPVTFNIVLLGKSGTGKSASANTILAAVTSCCKRSNRFKSESDSLPVTTQCQEREVQLPSGIMLRVVDTPDFFYERLQNCQKKIEECKKYCQEEHCVMLVVLQASRVQDNETKILENLEKKLGYEIRNKTIVLLTHGDDLNKQQSSLDKLIDEHDPLKNMIALCSNRYHLFNNKCKDTKQVKELFKKIPNSENYFQNFKKKKCLDCFVC